MDEPCVYFPSSAGHEGLGFLKFSALEYHLSVTISLENKKGITFYTGGYPSLAKCSSPTMYAKLWRYICAEPINTSAS